MICNFFSDFFSTIRKNGNNKESMLTDVHIDRFSSLIPEMHMQTPLLTQFLNEINRVDEEFVQILFTTLSRTKESLVGHWTCVWYHQGVLHVFDSLGWNLHEDHLKYLARILPDVDILEVFKEKVQLQSQGYNCGPFSIVFSISVMCGICPCNLNFDESQLRNYLIKMFSENQISSFPNLKKNNFNFNGLIFENRDSIHFDHAKKPEKQSYDLRKYRIPEPNPKPPRVIADVDLTKDTSLAK